MYYFSIINKKYNVPKLHCSNPKPCDTIKLVPIKSMKLTINGAQSVTITFYIPIDFDMTYVVTLQYCITRIANTLQ